MTLLAVIVGGLVGFFVGAAVGIWASTIGHRSH